MDKLWRTPLPHKVKLLNSGLVLKLLVHCVLSALLNVFIAKYHLATCEFADYNNDFYTLYRY